MNAHPPSPPLPPSSPHYFADPRNPASCGEDFVEDGIVAWGSMPDDPEIAVAVLRDAYDHGIFPWPLGDETDGDGDALPIPWTCPDPRGILEFSQVRWPRSFNRFLKKDCSWSVTFNQAFGQVIRACAEARKSMTWITPEMIAAYENLHATGDAFSVEVWEVSPPDGGDPAVRRLIGGLYGVSRQGCFGGESMFHLKSNASKVALYALVQCLSSQGVGWLDIQQLTPHLEAIGAREMPRAEFLDLLHTTQQRLRGKLPIPFPSAFLAR